MCRLFTWPAATGPLVWLLPSALRLFPSGLERYRRFAVHLLQGDVCPPLAAFAAALLAPPATMTKSWARCVPGALASAEAAFLTKSGAASPGSYGYFGGKSCFDLSPGRTVQTLSNTVMVLSD